MSSTSLTLGAAAFLAASSPASAQSHGANVVVEQVPVSYLDLDLSTRQGADLMLARLRRAALRVCGERAPIGQEDLAMAIDSDIRACRIAAVERAVAQLDRPLVTAAYRGRVEASKAGGSPALIRPAMLKGRFTG